MQIPGLAFSVSGLDCNKSKNRFANIFPCKMSNYCYWTVNYLHLSLSLSLSLSSFR